MSKLIRQIFISFIFLSEKASHKSTNKWNDSVSEPVFSVYLSILCEFVTKFCHFSFFYVKTFTMTSFQQMLAFKRELLITGKYRIIRRIGGGSFGDIYLGINVSNGEVSTCKICWTSVVFNLSELPVLKIPCGLAIVKLCDGSLSVRTAKC